MKDKIEIIASHLLYKFLNDKFSYCGEPLDKGKLDYIDKTLSINRLRWLVHMFIDKNACYNENKREIENKIIDLATDFIKKERLVQR